MRRSRFWTGVARPGLWLLLAALGVGLVLTGRGGLAAQQAADMVLLNGKIVTGDRAFSIKQAVAVKDGKFLAVGTNDEVRRLVGAGTHVIDLEGRTVLPGLIDSHLHAIRHGLT